MILYSIQPEYRINELKNSGVLVAGDIICDNDYIKPYSWMENKMKFIQKPILNIKHPIWAWYRYNGKIIEDNLPINDDNEYVIIFEINDDEVLLSDYMNWHFILNAKEIDYKNNYTTIVECDELESTSIEEINAYLKEGSEMVNGEIIFDWNKIILDVNSNCEYIQATLWKIDINQVLDIIKVVK